MIKQIIKSLFKKKAKKNTLNQNDRIRLTTPDWGRLEDKTNVVIEKHCILSFITEKKGMLYFRVISPFYTSPKHASDRDIVMISRYRFDNSLKYKTA
jgi:hypothetical protein